MKDKYKALWLSHSSIGDFLRCPRSYYLKNMYRNPETNKKIQIMTMPLFLGSIVHETLEKLSPLRPDRRFENPLLDDFEELWRDGIESLDGLDDKEDEYRQRGQQMIQNVIDNPGPLLKRAGRIKQDLPQYWLSEEENMILCGKVDWMEYLPETDAFHVIDFKTGKHEEKANSLQLPIYYLLITNCQKRKVEKMSYWYLGQEEGLKAQLLPDLDEAHQKIISIAQKIKAARLENKLSCPWGGCPACKPFEAVLRGEMKFAGLGRFNSEIYIQK